MNEQIRSGYLGRIARMMSREGWEICSMESDSECFLVYIFQSKKDHSEDRVMCQSIGTSFDDAFTKCLSKIIEFYRRDITPRNKTSELFNEFWSDYKKRKSDEVIT